MFNEKTLPFIIKIFILTFWMILGLAFTRPEPFTFPAGLTVPRITVTSPLPGQVVQGTVIIQGSTNLRDFQSTEVAFSYADDPTDTWFLITSSDKGVVRETIALWDTTSITDGNYRLRVTVITLNGTKSSLVVNGLRVRNYSAAETDTPIPTQLFATAAPASLQASPTATLWLPSPSPLPTNPASLNQGDLTRSLFFGIGSAFTLFVAGFIYLAIRKSQR